MYICLFLHFKFFINLKIMMKITLGHNKLYKDPTLKMRIIYKIIPYRIIIKKKTHVYIEFDEANKQKNNNTISLFLN
jgi:hypothetical protein